MKRMMRGGLLGATLVIATDGALADPVAELRCLEHQWNVASHELQEGRADIWARVAQWLETPDRAHCSRVVPAGENWRLMDTFAWRCAVGDGYAESTLMLQPVNTERLSRQEGVMAVLGLVYAFTAPEMQRVFDNAEAEMEDLAEDLAEVMTEVIEAIPSEELLTMRADAAEQSPKSVDDLPDAERETRSLGELIALVSPLQSTWGLTADIKLSFEISGKERSAIEPFIEVNSLFRSLSGLESGARAADAFGRVNNAITGQAKVWSRDHMALTASRFRLFDRPVEIVQQHSDRVEVIDIASWERSSGTDWDANLDEAMMEGVNRLVFYYEPQPDAAPIVDALDCKALGTFPCPPLNGGRTVGSTPTQDVPDEVGPNSCDISTVEWINEHVAIHTQVRAKCVSSSDLLRFADDLLTFQTSTLLDGLSGHDGDFDPGTECRG